MLLIRFKVCDTYGGIPGSGENYEALCCLSLHLNFLHPGRTVSDARGSRGRS